MTAHPDKLLLIHALIDGELDAASSVAIEAHLRDCGDCQAEFDRISAIRDIFRTTPIASRAPRRLHARVDAMFDEDHTSAATGNAAPAYEALPSERTTKVGGAIVSHVWNSRWASGALTGALAACLMLMVAAPQLAHTDTTNQLIQGHIRSLQPGHLVDIPTSDRHVVKPWFNGKVDFAPSVPDLKAAGLPLIGGRLDYIDGHDVAAIVYASGRHIINLFVKPAHGVLPGAFVARSDGYSVVRWTAGGLEYWAVSDVDSRELERFRQSYIAHARP